MKNKAKVIIGLALALAVTTSAVNAQMSSAAKKGLWGAGIGAIAGGVIGGDWSDAAVGAAAGGGIGYVIGNEEDKKRAQEQAAREQAARDRARVSSDPKTAYQAPETNRFVGSSWRVVSLVSEDPYPEYASMVVTFPSNSKVTTMAVHKDGTAESWVESYRIVDDVMVVSGKDPKTGKSYVISFKYSVDGNQLIVVSPETRVVLEEVEEKV